MPLMLTVTLSSIVSLVGFLGGFQSIEQLDVLEPVLKKSAILRGLIPGSKSELQDLCNFLDEKAIRLTPLLDESRFSFDIAKDALNYPYGGKHMAKVVLTIYYRLNPHTSHTRILSHKTDIIFRFEKATMRNSTVQESFGRKALAVLYRGMSVLVNTASHSV
ncbi:hypothetical protein ASPACDRAFT_41582 [Aspergillus aculeatus ATCC 16872]|uniref:Uncharacterized protein n=1 Tax=Aspergillus aculeatus (strain ATCC 16872 / CBS 172.66 / WB 5094) TaxID=690307 RepID=A0A1L9WYJ7_ASPA1|nr:uncharacterized protein ASPACDRAFT_41582 [Aspergillus aculeatus ATCC 16872]OJK01322.1 hypothetical protein ASPACDRAFT_41582 [Aspergillus aculeatus ATCC 16872]